MRRRQPAPAAAVRHKIFFIAKSSPGEVQVVSLRTDAQFPAGYFA
jgi:hypothetical protein